MRQQHRHGSRLVFGFALCALLYALCGFAAPAEAGKTKEVFTVALPTSGVSDPGISAVVTGVSGVLSSGTPFAVNGNSGVTFFDMTKTEFTFLTVQPRRLTPLTAVTPIPSSEVGVTLYLQGYNHRDGTDGSEQANASEKIPIIINQQLSSGNSLYPVPAGVFDYNFLYPTFESNCTAWSRAEFDFVFSGDDQPNRYVQLLPLRHNESAFSTSGSSSFASGATRVAAAPGARCIQVQPVGDAIHFTTDGSAPSTSSTKIANGSVWEFAKEEWAKFWFKPAGSSAGTLNIDQFNRKP